MQRMQQEIAGWSSSTFWMMSAVLATLWLSGTGLYLLPADALPDMTPVQETLRRSCVLVHGVFAWLFGVMLGRGVWPHVRLMWTRQTRRVRWTGGMINLALLLFLALGGLMLLYGSPGLHEVLSGWHFWAALPCPVLYLWHAGRRFFRDPARGRQRQ